MVGLFCFDGPLYKDKNGVYCNITLTNQMFNRYFEVVDKLIVIVRTYDIDKTFEEVNMKPLNLNNIEVIEAKNFNNIRGIFIEKPKFEEYIKKIVLSVDLIFARMPSTTANVVLKIAKKNRKPYLVEVGGCAWDSFWNHGLLGKLVAPYMFYCERYYVKNAAYATYVTKKFLQNRYPTKGESINASNVYLKETTEELLLKRIEKICNMKKNEIVIGTAVNSIDVKYKGEQYIIRIIKQLEKKGINVKYEIVGPGTGKYILEQAMKYNVSDSVKILGTMKKEEIYEWYSRIDIYTQPSKQEGLPRAVIEAMSTGCPVVASNIAGIPELIEAEFLFNPNKAREIIGCIERILDLETMKKSAINNFNVSKEYDILLLENKRKNFFKKYRNSIRSE